MVGGGGSFKKWIWGWFWGWLWVPRGVLREKEFRNWPKSAEKAKGKGGGSSSRKGDLGDLPISEGFGKKGGENSNCFISELFC